MTESPNQIQLKKGALELCVLALLALRESYAYEIASTLATAVGMGEGTIYPLMRRMQDDGLVDTRLVESSSGPPRKYYRLTASGRDPVAELGKRSQPAQLRDRPARARRPRRRRSVPAAAAAVCRRHRTVRLRRRDVRVGNRGPRHALERVQGRRLRIDHQARA